MVVVLLSAACIFISGCFYQAPMQDQSFQEAGKKQAPSSTKSDEPVFLLLPEDLNEGDPLELDVVVESDSDVVAEGYFVEVYALRPPNDKEKTPASTPIGGKDVFKPLLKKEDTVVYVEIPTTKDIWYDRAGNKPRLRLGVRVKPTHPDRVTPNVKLRIKEIRILPAKSHSSPHDG